jgi:hypothetical protein
VDGCVGVVLGVVESPRTQGSRTHPPGTRQVAPWFCLHRPPCASASRHQPSPTNVVVYHSLIVVHLSLKPLPPPFHHPPSPNLPTSTTYTLKHSQQITACTYTFLLSCPHDTVNGSRLVAPALPRPHAQALATRLHDLHPPLHVPSDAPQPPPKPAILSLRNPLASTPHTPSASRASPKHQTPPSTLHPPPTTQHRLSPFRG